MARRQCSSRSLGQKTNCHVGVDEFLRFGGDFRSAGAMARKEAPVPPKAGTMPAYGSLRLCDQQAAHSTRQSYFDDTQGTNGGFLRDVCAARLIRVPGRRSVTLKSQISRFSRPFSQVIDCEEYGGIEEVQARQRVLFRSRVAPARLSATIPSAGCPNHRDKYTRPGRRSR